ncbi:MAG: xanthine dehydrogenase family protein subunit M [Armatimonadetes bacterium]|nr:xanthine dehydrogenase family protein subunit M [Armatimonadota bacterium]
MKDFEYLHPHTIGQARQLLASSKNAEPIAGGIDLLGMMKDYIDEPPDRVVNLKSIPGLNRIRQEKDGLHLGPMVLLVDLEEDKNLQQKYTAVSQAAASVGSVQMRNQGTLGGNLCQRPRCWYFRSPVHHCLKKGGTTCFAMAGENKYNCILGGGPSFIVHPSDLAPALMALNAKVTITGPNNKSRTIPLEEFYILPRVDPHKETVLKPGELVTNVIVPPAPAGSRSIYLKFKEKPSMDFALSAAAVNLTLANGVCKDARVVLGGVAPIPWRAKAAEAALKGKTINEAVAQAAAVASTQGAVPMAQNAYKVPLTQTLVKRAVLASAGIPQPAL